MLEFPGGSGSGEIRDWTSMLEKYVGNAGGVWEKEERSRGTMENEISI